MHKHLKLYVSIIALLAASVASAQVTLRSNDKAIRYDLIKSGQQFVKVTGYDSLGKQQFQFVNYNIIKVDSANKQILFGRSRSIPFGRYMIDTSITSFAGPVRYSMTTNPNTKFLDVRYSPTTAQAHAIIKGVSSNISTPMSEGYFDDNIVEDLLGYLPIQKGVKYQLDAYRFESDNKINHFDLEYAFDDVLTDPKGGVDICSVIRFRNGYGNGYIWISKKTHENLKEVLYTKDAVVLLQAI
jgi:hypothetical protein